MNPELKQRIERASELFGDARHALRSAHSLSCHCEPMAELLLRDMLEQSKRITDRLAEMEACE